MLKKDNKQNVYLYTCEDYRKKHLEPVISQVVSELVDVSGLYGKTVLLKPNLISSRGPALACTDKNFVAALAKLFLDYGCKVKVGDSPAFGSVHSVLARHGILQEIESLSVNVVQFKNIVSRILDSGVEVELAAEAMECDLLVNVPRLKAHNQMYVTCAVKNLFGTVVGIRKAVMHMRYGGSHAEFSDILIRLPDFLPEHITVADGIEVMHRSGPIDGDKLLFKVVGGANCPVALDTAFLEVLNLPMTKSPLWNAAKRMNHKGCRIEDLHFPAMTPDKVGLEKFIPPLELNPIRFNPLRFLTGTVRRLTLAFRS